MLIALALAAAFAGQDASPASPETGPAGHPTLHVFTRGGLPQPGQGRQGPIDKNGDGLISREEFIAPQVQAFDFLDKDRDGKVSTAELVEGRPAAMAVLSEGGPFGVEGVGPSGDPMAVLSGEGGRMMFIRRGSFVANGSGPAIDGHVSVHRIPGVGATGHDSLDKNDDGKISEDEFGAPVREAFERMDTDRSGTIDPGESASGAGVRIVTSRALTPAG